VGVDAVVARHPWSWRRPLPAPSPDPCVRSATIGRWGCWRADSSGTTPL
jgi:hypothetical protein